MPASALMNPLTTDDIARARASWRRILAMESLETQSISAALWASLWGSRLLDAAEGRTAPFWLDSRAFPRTEEADHDS